VKSNRRLPPVWLMGLSNSTVGPNACRCAFSISPTIGQNNPLAATTFAFLTAATNIPVTYMMVADGRGYARGGIAGSLAVDAGIGIIACLSLGLLLYQLPRKTFGAGAIEPL
jgi:hypothetical protein